MPVVVIESFCDNILDFKVQSHRCVKIKYYYQLVLI